MDNEIMVVNTLIEKAKKKILEMPQVEQIIGVKTKKNNIYFFGNNVLSKGAEDEEKFWKSLCDRGDTQIEYIVCMWSNSEMDIPSMNFLKMILKSDGKNSETILILQGENKIIGRTVESCMP